MVIESWLNEAAPADRRGSVLAVYTMISLLAMMLGQSFLGLAEPADLKLVMGAAFIMGIAVIPIGLTPMAAPEEIPRARFSPRVIGRASRVAVVCAFCGGLVTGSFWSVGPLVGRAYGLDGSDIGLMMAAAIVGGALVQLPVGRLSDHMDRRKVIAGLFLASVTASFAGWLLVGESRLALFAVMFCFGATAMPIYALCIATASDNSDLPLIQIASSILIMNSLGSILGPMLVAQVMATMGGGGFFVFAIVGMGLGGLWALYRIAVIERPRHHEHPFAAVPRTSFVATELVDEEPVVSTQSPTGPEVAEEAHGTQRT
jgi:MFS family permease